MQRFYLLALGALFLSLLGACGGHSSSDLEPTLLQLGGTAADSAQIPPPPPEAAGLPALSELPKPSHEVSQLGPGWEPLSYRAIVSQLGNSIGSGGTMNLGLTGDFNYAVFGAYGFDGDNGPTSARISSGDAASQVYIGFTDYLNGRWVWSGPFSMPAGGGVIETAIPNTGDYVSPTAFVADLYSATYVVVAVAAGGQLAQAQLELGVHGGEHAPGAPLGMNAYSAEDTIQITWLASISELDPDFEGYVIERAPFLGGEYTRLTPEALPVKPASFLDSSAVVGENYRYRMASIDRSGNLSLWITDTATLSNGPAQQRPVVVVDLPDGPLFGVQQITVDMSASFDPLGEPIDTYQVFSAGEELYNGASEQVSLTLQPGCHLLELRVKAGSRTGQLRHYLKVYPVWEDEAVLVSAPRSQPVFPRVLGLEGLRDPASGNVFYSGFDATIPGWAFRRLQPQADSSLAVANFSQAPTATTEPVMFQGQYYTVGIVEGKLMLMRFDGESVEQVTTMSSSPMFTLKDCALTCTEDEIYAFVTETDGAVNQMLTLQYPRVNVIGAYNLPEAGQSLDAAWDPVGNNISVVFGGNTQVYWYRFTVAGHTFDASASLGGGPASNVDVEIQPANGEPALAYINGGKVQYRSRNTDNSWDGPDEIDPTGGQGTGFDLEFEGDLPRILASEIGGQLSVYKGDGQAGWTAHDIPFADATFSAGDLTIYEENGETWYGCLFTATDRSIQYERLDSNDNTSPFLELPATTGQGYQMYAAPGSDGLHIVWRDALTNNAHHVTGSNDALSWTDEADLPGTRNLDLSSLADGTVYLARGDNLSVFLDRWTGNAWSNVYTHGATDADYRPFLSHSRGEKMHFLAYEEATENIVAVHGNEGDGYVNDSVLLLDPALYTGACLSSDGNQADNTGTYFVIGGSLLGYSAGEVGMYRGLEEEAAPLYPTERANDVLYETEIFGRNLACAHYLDAFLHAPSGNVWYASTGVQALPLRFSQADVDNLNGYEYLPLTKGGDVLPDDRFTVSAATAQSLTGVGLVSGVANGQHYLEWSDFGRWEELPLPQPDSAQDSDRYMNQAQLLVDADGRWHIIYRDYDSDSIYIRSTT